MIDFHCHLDLYSKPLDILSEVKRQENIVFAVTTSPRAYLKANAYFRDANQVYVGLGFHPELLSQRENEIELFMKLLKTTRYIGEVGIDGTNTLKDSYQLQKRFLSDVISEAESIGGKVISVHSRKATKDVISILGETTSKNKYILHWFTGSLNEAKTALSYGCWFSINPKMCFSESGKSIIRALPIERIVPETDAPFATANSRPYMPWDMTVVDYLAKARHLSRQDAFEIVKINAKKLLE